MYDVIIIGKGPAGISASLYTVRANLKTLIIGTDDSALMKAEKIENYYGFSQVISGKDLLLEGEKQARRIGAEFLQDEVVAIEKNEFFEVKTATQNFTAKTVLLATGQPQKKVRIEKLQHFEGRGVSYCTTCDGFFYRNLKVGVVGFKDYAVHEAMELLPFTKNITLYTNGVELQLTDKYKKEVEQFQINPKPILELDGDEFLKKIYFQDGTSEYIDGIFIAYESASSIDFARKLGIIVDKNSVVVDQQMRTNLEGLFAAGDCTGGFKQISTSVGQGALAARKMIEYVRSM